MTQKITLSETQRDSLGLLYFCVKNAKEVLEALAVDKTLNGYVRHAFIRLWLIAITKIKGQLDKNLGCNDRFEDQIRDSDTIGLHDVVAGYIALSPEMRSEVEKVFIMAKNDASQLERLDAGQIKKTA